MEDYNALLIIMKIAYELDDQDLGTYDDSMLVVNQVRGEFEVRHEDLVSYHAATLQVAGLFNTFYIQHIPRN